MFGFGRKKEKPSEKRAAANDPRELIRLAQEYYDAADYERALPCFEKLAQMGYSEAQYLCAQMYEDGKGAAQDLRTALSWYEKAAAQGDGAAMIGCAMVYMKNEENMVTFDGMRAVAQRKLMVEWLQKAVDHGAEGAQEMLDAVMQVPMPDFVVSLEEIAERGRRRHAPSPFPDEKGDGGEAEYQGAMELYAQARYPEAFARMSKAAAQGSEYAQYFCGRMCENGQGAEKDEENALDWYRRAGVQGHPAAQAACGRMYAEGRGAARDTARARVWLETAAAQTQDQNAREEALALLRRLG